MNHNKEQQKPNIILVVMDSLRYDHVGKNNQNESLTPNMDRLMKQAFVFSQAIAQGPSTRVSMSAMMSSTYASMYGGAHKLSPRRPVIQQMLKRAGYVTAGVTANLYLSKSFGWNRDFDHYDDCRPESIYRRKHWLRLVNQIGKRIGMPLIWPKSLPAELVFESAWQFLDNARSPFFLWVHLMDTHWPYAIQKFSWASEWKRQRMADEKIRPRLISDPPALTEVEAKKLHEEYRTSVAYTDEQVGSFVSKLEREGVLANSWLVLTADHGEEFLDHGRFFHHPTPYEELAHVPLIILPPQNSSIRSGQEITAQVRLIDLAPTFLELAGGSPPPGVQLFGESLAPLLVDRKAIDHRPALTESPHNQALSIRVGNWKYIWEIHNNQRMLFDLSKDPLEKNNLVAIAPEQAEELHLALKEHMTLVRETSGENSEKEDDLSQEMIERLRDLGYVE